MNSEDPTLAARFFFRNCAVSLHLPGEMRISRTLIPGPNDVVLDREFTPAGSPSEFIGDQSDFYRFLDATSSTNGSLVKKLAAIGSATSSLVAVGAVVPSSVSTRIREPVATANPSLQ